ncbi:unnamed protein product, partial [Aphanomyces euteiches]
VVGEVECVVVEIGYEEPVFTLKEKIKEMLGYPGLAKDLQLFLALENRQWLGAEAVEGGELAETIKEILQREKRLASGVAIRTYFVGQEGDMKPVIALGQVHVLVAAPEYDTAKSMPHAKSDLLQLRESIVEGFESAKKRKKTDRTSWSCSKLSADQIKQLGYEPMFVSWPTVDDVSSERDYPAFKWNDDMSESNPTHVKPYKEYIAAVLEDTKFLSIKTDLNLGISVGKDHRFLKGKADLCIVPAESLTVNEIVMVIELKSGSREETLEYPFYQWRTLTTSNRTLDEFERRMKNNGEPLDRKTALYYMRKHCNFVDSCVQDPNTVLSDVSTAPRDPHVVFGAFPAGELEKYVIEYEDNMADVLETDEEIRFYQMSNRLRHTTAFEVPSEIPLFMYS